MSSGYLISPTVDSALCTGQELSPKYWSGSPVGYHLSVAYSVNGGTSWTLFGKADSCVNSCDNEHPLGGGGCFCDAACVGLGDCCADRQAWCQLGTTPTTLTVPVPELDHKSNARIRFGLYSNFTPFPIAFPGNFHHVDDEIISQP